MKERIEKIKTHIYKHRVVYSCSVTAVVVAGITFIVMRGRYAEIKRVSDEDLILNKLFVRPFNFLSNNNDINANIITVIEREGRGHPGYIVRCLETGEVFLSQTQAAIVMEIPATVISDHLRGKFDHANGYHFERICAAAVTEICDDE